MADPNPLLRYWCVAGCVTLGKAAAPAREALLARLDDDNDTVRLHAARALAGIGDRKVGLPVIREALQSRDHIRVLQALLVVDECGLLDVDPSLRELIKKASGSYGQRVATKLLTEPVTK